MENKLRKIAVIGAGGINSWVCEHLYKLMETFDKKELLYVKIFDKDLIEEKNILRQNQNFKVEDLMEEKAESLGKRYSFEYENVFITEDNINDLKSFDDIIVGVDNNKVRNMLYKFACEHNIYLLDLRAQGTQMAYYVVDGSKDYKYYKETLFNNIDVMERKGSCQLKHDIENDHIENANKVIAFFGVNSIYLKHLRNEKLNTNEWRFAY